MIVAASTAHIPRLNKVERQVNVMANASFPNQAFMESKPLNAFLIYYETIKMSIRFHEALHLLQEWKELGDLFTKIGETIDEIGFRGKMLWCSSFIHIYIMEWTH